MFSKFLDRINPETFGGLVRLLAFAFGSMFLVHVTWDFDPIQFPVEKAGNLDYGAMVVLKAFLIAIDAMLIVVLSWRNLNTAQDVLLVAGFVGLTHVFFPLLTFALAAGATFGIECGLSPSVANAPLSAVYFVAFLFVFQHLREVLEGAYEGDAEQFPHPEGNGLWQRIKLAWPAVLGVSIDALIVGPSAVPFMARYTHQQFMWSFVLIGAGVFFLVMCAGFLVLWLKAKTKNSVRIAATTHELDFWGTMALIGVFMHFGIFAGVYWIYTLFPEALLLKTASIWTLTILFYSAFLAFGEISKIKRASLKRAGLITA